MTNNFIFNIMPKVDSYYSENRQMGSYSFKGLFGLPYISGTYLREAYLWDDLCVFRKLRAITKLCN